MALLLTDTNAQLFFRMVDTDDVVGAQAAGREGGRGRGGASGWVGSSSSPCCIRNRPPNRTSRTMSASVVTEPVSITGMMMPEYARVKAQK